MKLAQIDCHVLFLDGANAEFLRDCLASIPSGLNVSLVSGVAGNLGESRVKGFKTGNAPFVTYIDYDDLFCADYFDEAIEILESRNDVVAVGPTWAAFGMRETIGKFPAHGTVYRRADIEPLYARMRAFLYYPDTAMRNTLKKKGEFVCLETLGYLWRIHPAQMSLGAKNRDEMRRASLL